jgi:hypothetical protein
MGFCIDVSGSCPICVVFRIVATDCRQFLRMPPGSQPKDRSSAQPDRRSAISLPARRRRGELAAAERAFLSAVRALLERMGGTLRGPVSECTPGAPLVAAGRPATVMALTPEIALSRAPGAVLWATASQLRWPRFWRGFWLLARRLSARAFWGQPRARLIRRIRREIVRHVAVATEDHSVLPLAEPRVTRLAEGDRAVPPSPSPARRCAP